MFQTTKQMVMMFLAIVSYEMVVSTHPKLVKWVGQIYCHGKLGDSQVESQLPMAMATRVALLRCTRTWRDPEGTVKNGTWRTWRTCSPLVI